MKFPSTPWFAAMVMLAAAPALAQEGLGPIVEGVPSANPKSSGTPATLLDPDFRAVLIASGDEPLENPSGNIVKFGLLIDNTPTEPDEHTYLILPKNPGGPDKSYNYGRRFLFQGHENGGDMAYVTRINLDVPRGDKHRITLLTPVDAKTGLMGFNRIDGSTCDPFTGTLLFTEEEDTSDHTGAGRVIQITPTWPPKVTTLEAFLGLGGYEGIHPDGKGNIYLVEDVGGAKNSATNARQPNSFVYRYLPNDPKDLTKGGKMQALRVLIGGKPIVFNAADPDGDIMAPAQLQLHSFGTSYPIKWVTIHTSKAGDTAAFDANAAAKAAGATPFKRPENLAWLPGSNFGTFFFCPTGDTNAIAGENPELAARGAYGAIFRVDLGAKDSGVISIFILGDREHNSFDNIAFSDSNSLLAAEDRGDTLHDQLNTLDSVWAFSLNSRPPVPFPGALKKGNPKSVRFIALGQDASAVARKVDNEPTGLFVSNGGPLLGAPSYLAGATGFITRQHGDNKVFRLVRVRKP